nr:cell division protein CrgA [Bifidobacterium cuniculi]
MVEGVEEVDTTADDGGEEAEDGKAAQGPTEADEETKAAARKARGDEDDEPADKRFTDDGNPTLEEAATYAEDDEIPMGKIQDVLNATLDSKDMSPQMRRLMQRQADNTKRVQESIKGTKANPSWYVPLFCVLMVIGLVWAVVFYLTGNQYPIPGIGFWNLLIAFAFILAGFIMTVWWK